MVSLDCKINMKLLMVAPILCLVFVGDGKFTSGKICLKNVNQQNLPSGSIFVSLSKQNLGGQRGTAVRAALKFCPDRRLLSVMYN